MIGQQLSHYEILSRIAETTAGAMYKARDLEANRLVAIRVLSVPLTATPEKRRRLQEAVAAAAAVSHPNLAQAYEFTSAEGQDFIVSELVEGESLDVILRRERLHRRDLFLFAAQIAGALDTLHSAGQIHGGLNSQRIVLNVQSKIKVLDAGLDALLRVEGDEFAPEIACFCSPEQVEGEPLDARSDIFSFGSVLYYMTTRRRAFRRETFTETLEAVLKDEPKPVDSATRHAPRGVEKIIKRCLRKDPDRRFQSVADLEALLEKLAAQFESRAHTGLPRSSRSSSKLPWIAAAAAAATIVAALGLWLASLSFKKVDQNLTQITLEVGLDTEPSLSSSAQQIAYTSDRSGEGNLDIWMQPLASHNPVRLTNDPADDHEPSLSPDGTAVAFRSERDGGGVYLAHASGGGAKLLAREGRRPRFSPDGKWIAYWTGQAEGTAKIFLMSSDGAGARQLAPDFLGAFPVWAPDSRSVLFLGRKTSGASPADADWWVAPIDPGPAQNTGACRAFRQHAILRSGFCPEPGDWRGKKIYFTMRDEGGSNVFQAEILPSRDIAAKPVQMTSGAGLYTQPAATDEGKVVFSKQSLNVDIWTAPLHGNTGKLGGEWKKLTTDPAADIFPSLSANGARMAFQSNRRGVRSAWLLDLNSRLETAVAGKGTDMLWPRLSPDGAKLSYAQEASGAYDRFVIPAAGGKPEPLCRGCGRDMDWSRDGSSALIEDAELQSVAMVKPPSTAKIQLLMRATSAVTEPRFSPDQRSVAFTLKTEPAVSRVYVAGLHGESAVPWVEWLPLTTDYAWEGAPQWSPDGKLVYFISDRDGHRCLWARRVDEARAKTGEPFAVNHFHDARRSPANAPLNAEDLFIGSDQIVVGLGELSGSLWMLSGPAPPQP